MTKRIYNKISKTLPFILILIAVFLAYKNYIPGTWLTGWDNLHSEFAPFLNLKRSFYAVWQEYQGVGLLSGNAHASEFSRELILFAVSPVVPAFLMRYFWTFLMLVLGPLGIYFLVTKHLLFEKEEVISRFAGFVAGAFYLLNLATVQTFYTPYEAFVGFFGFLPWLIFFVLNYLRKGTKKNLLILLLVSFFASSAFYVLTPFIVYFVVLLIFLLGEVIRAKLPGIKRSLIVLFVVFAANAFWLLPSAYFAVNNIGVVSDSKINSFSTPETKLMNQATGNLSNLASLKGFWFNYLDLGQNGKFNYLMVPWRDYFVNSDATMAAYVLFAFAVLGLVLSLIKKKLPAVKISAVFLFLTSYFMMATVNFPFGSIYSYLANNIPLFDVVFRSPFTKWSTVSAFSYALGLGYFVYILLSALRKVGYILASLVVVILLALMIWVTQPAFHGNLIMNAAKNDIPAEYFELYEFFDSQPEQARVAFFPIQTIWGWNFYDWGYRGSGFLWYGIKQPILDRAFDVWSPYNEAFFTEVSNDFYGKDKEGLAKVFDKYSVVYVLLDENVIVPEQESDFLRFNETEKLLEDMGAKLVFNEGDIKVYDLRNNDKKFVFTPETYSLVADDLDRVRVDSIFRQFGNYAKYKENSSDVTNQALFPFSGLFAEEVDGVSYEDGVLSKTWINIERQLPEGNNYQLTIPPIRSGTIYQGVANISLNQDRLLIDFEPSIVLDVEGKKVNIPQIADLEMELGKIADKVLVSINGKTVLVSGGEKVVGEFPLWAGEEVAVEVFDATNPQNINISESLFSQDVNNCWEREGQDGELGVAKSGDVMTFEVKDLVGCSYVKLGQLEGKKALLSISLPYKSYNSSRPDFCLVAEGEYECLNDEVFYKTAPNSDWTQVERNTILETDTNYWLGIQAKPSDEAGKKWKIDYKAPDITSYPLISSATFDAGLWQDLVKETKVTGLSGKVKLSFFGIKDNVDLAITGKDTADNCDLFERGSVEKEIVGGKILYESNDRGSICDYSPLSDINTTGSYFLRFVGENLSGRGLKFYLFNKASRHSDLNVLLNEGRFDQTFSILSWLFIEPDTYVLNLENRSFGEDARALLEDVEIYQVPIDWLSTWNFKPEDAAGVFDLNNDAQVSNLKKWQTYKYTFDVKGNGLVVLSQGYDRGWVAYEKNGFLPAVFSNKLKHVKVNGWANGWFTPRTTDNGKRTTVSIVFWPQYLEYLGFGLGIAVFTVLAISGFRLTNRRLKG